MVPQCRVNCERCGERCVLLKDHKIDFEGFEEHQCICNASGLHCQSEMAVEARSEMVELLKGADDLYTRTSNVQLPDEPIAYIAEPANNSDCSSSSLPARSSRTRVYSVGQGSLLGARERPSARRPQLAQEEARQAGLYQEEALAFRLWLAVLDVQMCVMCLERTRSCQRTDRSSVRRLGGVRWYTGSRAATE